jgi:hypothetical protein
MHFEAHLEVTISLDGNTICPSGTSPWVGAGGFTPHQFLIPSMKYPLGASLVGGFPTTLKNMSSSVGIIIPNLWKVIKFMFQTTNQLIYDWNIFIFGPTMGDGIP